MNVTLFAQALRTLADALETPSDTAPAQPAPEPIPAPAQLAPVPTPAPVPAPAAQEVTPKDVLSAYQQVAREVGATEATNIVNGYLTKYNVVKMGEMTQDQLREVLTALQGALL